MKITLALAILLCGSVVGACGGDGAAPVDASMDAAIDGTLDSTVDAGAGVCEGAADGTSCGVGAFCIGEVCTAGRCGDAVLEVEAGEQCDDGANGDDGDGCRDDCTFTCEEDADCDDGDPCTGVESCDIALHLCSNSGPLDCDDLDPCTIDGCDTGVGCAHVLDDGDLDGYAPAATCTTAGLMGGDCDDTKASVHPGAPEHCDSLDNDCDGAIDEGLATLICLRDADRDGYGDPSVTLNACTCPPGYVGVRADGETDCSDREPDAYPGQPAYFVNGYCPDDPICPVFAVSYDYNCDGADTVRPLTGSLACMLITAPSGDPLCIGSGWEDGYPACGASGDFQTCTLVASPTPHCTASSASRRQECR